MKRALAAVLLAAVAVSAAGCASARPVTLESVQLAGARPIVSRANAVQEVSGLLHAPPNWVRLVRVNDGELAWLGFSPRPTPAAAYVDAHGNRFSAVSSVRVPGTHPSPLAVVHALQRTHKKVWLEVLGAHVPFPHYTPTVVHPDHTRAEMLKSLAGGMGGKLERLQLVWADQKTTDVVLQWVAYFAHAHIQPLGGPLGRASQPPTYVGPAVEWTNAQGTPYGGTASITPPRHHRIVPPRFDSIPVSLVQGLWRAKLDVWLAPLDARPAIIRTGALKVLGVGDARRVWLVFLRRDGREEGLAWLVARSDGSYGVVSATSGKVLVSAVKL